MTRSSRATATRPSRRCASTSPARWSTRASRSARWIAPRRRSVSTTRSSRATATRPSRRCASRSPKRWSTRASRSATLDRSEEALGVYDEVVARYGDAPEPALREQVARALVNKGVTLGELDRSEDGARRLRRGRRALRRGARANLAPSGRNRTDGAGRAVNQTNSAGRRWRLAPLVS